MTNKALAGMKCLTNLMLFVTLHNGDIVPESKRVHSMMTISEGVHHVTVTEWLRSIRERCIYCSKSNEKRRATSMLLIK